MQNSMSTQDRSILLCMALLAGVCVVSCASDFPRAAHQETLNQRHINGYAQYQQFVEANK